MGDKLKQRRELPNQVTRILQWAMSCVSGMNVRLLEHDGDALPLTGRMRFDPTSKKMTHGGLSERPNIVLQVVQESPPGALE